MLVGGGKVRPHRRASECNSFFHLGPSISDNDPRSADCRPAVKGKDKLTRWRTAGDSGNARLAVLPGLGDDQPLQAPGLSVPCGRRAFALMNEQDSYSVQITDYRALLQEGARTEQRTVVRARFAVGGADLSFASQPQE